MSSGKKKKGTRKSTGIATTTETVTVVAAGRRTHPLGNEQIFWRWDFPLAHPLSIDQETFASTDKTGSERKRKNTKENARLPMNWKHSSNGMRSTSCSYCHILLLYLFFFV